MYSAVAIPLFLLPAIASGASLYPKNSAVLSIDAKDYDRLIAKSNYTSIIEYYAPWCGHCQNLKPAYEKAAASLDGLVKVAAMNCDDEANKAFCGSQGVQGFPTLKIVKPAKKKGGKPIIEDYQGPRQAKAINEALIDKIPNHVTKLKDDTFEDWLEKDKDAPKALLFTEKSSVSPLTKALAIDFLGSISVGQVKSSTSKAVERFSVQKFPTIVLLPGSGQEAATYNGEMKKHALVAFLSQAAQPNPEFAPEKKTGDKKAKPKAAKKKASKAADAEGKATPPASCPMGHGSGPNPHAAASETLEDSSNPTESPDPDVTKDEPKPVRVAAEPAPSLTTLTTKEELQKACLHTKASTCVLALVPSIGEASDEQKEPARVALTALGELAHKHAQRQAKIFPFYAVSYSNQASAELIKALGLQRADGEIVVVAVNAKRGWWNKFADEELGLAPLEAWVDSIRFGENTKKKLPEGLIEEIQEEVKLESPAAEMPQEHPLHVEILEEIDVDPDHDEL